MNFKKLSQGAIAFVALLCISSGTMAQVTEKAKTALFDPNKLQLISRQFKFTEGPSADKEGNIYFTDQPNNKIWKYDVRGQLSVFMDDAGRPNGTYVDNQGNLVVCADEQQELWSISPSKKVEVLIKDLNGKHLNGPNDLWIDKKGGIYITDPYYQRDYWTRKAPELERERVYYLPKGKKELVMVTDAPQKPNGIVGTKDGKTLYVADIQGNKILKFAINEDGSLSNGETIINRGADGLTLDALGNIYLAGKGVTIFNNKGEEIGHIDIDEPWTANLCFGGKNHDELFITASGGFYKLPMQVKGGNR
jgi:gluconolactonase